MPANLSNNLHTQRNSQRRSAKIHRVAVMQPYFFPYAGYFRLFSETDEFIIFDCVQFPRRGRVHRTQVAGPAQTVEWLTLPLMRQTRDILIRDLSFSQHARSEFDARLERLPWIRSANGTAANRVRAFLFQPLNSVIDYLHASLDLVTELLGLTASIRRSSSLNLDPSLRGQARVIAAVQAVHGTHYFNSPGGRELYKTTDFNLAGIKLSFLPPYDGKFIHMLPALMSQDPKLIFEDIRTTG
jgi:WbqC-like protein